MARYSKTKTQQMVEELLTIQPVFERYRHLEKELKTALVKLKLDEIETDKGRVFISTSERMVLDPAIARSELGNDLAKKIIKVTESVSNPLLKAFHSVGEITDTQMEKLRKRAEKKRVVSLHVRPLK